MIQVVCFSRARPLQLHGYLTSLYEQWSGDFTVKVLVKVDPAYDIAYSWVTEQFREVKFWKEDNFSANLAEMIGDAEFTCFGCDDVVYVAPVSAEWAEMKIAEEKILGLSLRLGRNVTHDMFGAPLPQPGFGKHRTRWDFTTGVGDWGYPWEVLGTVYRTPFVKLMVSGLGANSPSQLEERGSHVWAPPAGSIRHMAAYPTSRLVVPTVNVVQHEFPNGIRGTKVLEPEFLLDCWNHGLRMDTKRYAGMQPESWRVPEFYMRRAA